MVYVGIDVSKRTFDAAIPQGARREVISLANTEEGFARLVKRLPQEAMCVMEASGPYGFRLASYLNERQIAVAVVNPLIIRRFGQMMLSRTKTDKADALLITSYAEKMHPEPWMPASRNITDAQQQRTAMEQLTKQRTQLRNSMQALEEMPYPSNAALDALRSVLRQVEEAIRNLEAQMEKAVAREYGELHQLLCSIKGIGKKTATELLVITHGFVRFASAKQLVAYIGICPRTFESGTSVRGKPRIVKLGMARTRRMLYMCAQSAISSNASCRALYQRLTQKGKSGKLALMAVANKLVRQAFAIAKSRRPYEPNFDIAVAFTCT